MPKSKNADVRIKVIDRCLSDKNRKYSTAEMMDLCNKELEKMDFPLISAPNSIRLGGVASEKPLQFDTFTGEFLRLRILHIVLD